MHNPDRDREHEWLGHVQAVGLVISPRVLSERGLASAHQTAADTALAAELLADKGPALRDAWGFVQRVLDWRPEQVAGAPGGPPLPDELRVHLAESDTWLEPHWAVAKPGGGWQLLVRLEGMGVAPDTRARCRAGRRRRISGSSACCARTP